MATYYAFKLLSLAYVILHLLYCCPINTFLCILVTFLEAMYWFIQMMQIGNSWDILFFFFIVHQVMPMPYQIVLWLSYHKNECDARQYCQYTVHMKIFTESEEPPADQSLEHQEAGTMLFRLCKG